MTVRRGSPAARDGRVKRWVGAILLMGVVAGALGVPNAGWWLIAEDPFSHADVAVVLSGEPLTRSLAARDLYQQGRVDRILVIPDPPRSLLIEAELVKLGLSDRNPTPGSERILLASGVPRARITFLPEPADGTIVEATHVRRFLKEHPSKSLVIVTARASSRRARFIFRRILTREGIQVWSFPTRYEAFEPARWWAQPRNALRVVTEYQKFLVNALTLTVGSQP